MKRLTIVAALLVGLLIGRLPVGEVTRLRFPTLMDAFVGVPVSATYLPTHLKSIQLRTVVMSSAGTINDTITSVSTTWSYLANMGFTWDASSAFNATACFLTSATNVACKDDPSAPVTTGVARYAVIEYFPGTVRSVQACTIPITNGNSNGTCTITSVSTSKSFLEYSGYRSTDSNGAATAEMATITLTAATTVTGVRSTASAGAGEISVFVVEGK